MHSVLFGKMLTAWSFAVNNRSKWRFLVEKSCLSELLPEKGKKIPDVELNDTDSEMDALDSTEKDYVNHDYIINS